jgi:transglutaminase-like putative cysteine protease
MFSHYTKFSILLLVLFSWLHASQLVSHTPAPPWVTPINADISAEPKKGEAGGSYYILIDYQYNVAREENYMHFAYKVLTSEGVQQLSDITVNFDPAFQRVLFHKVKIHRNGRIIDQLSSVDQVRLLQREESMDRYLYDGTMTAVVHLRDVRVGDIIEFEYTRKGYNPVYEGHISLALYFEYTQPFERLYNRIVCPISKVLEIKNVNCSLNPQIKKSQNEVEYIWDAPKTAALIPENNVPQWYDPYKRVMVTDFTSWSQVVTWAEKYFKVNIAELQTLKKKLSGKFTNTDKKRLTVEIIRFVQDEIRYLGFEHGLNSHIPHNPMKVCDQRFGDCKDKSLLLSAILNAYGIEAYPMLVNSRLQNEITKELPSHTIFDHCVVQIYNDGKSISIDPTCSNQGGTLDTYVFPFHGWGLVLKPGVTDLVEIQNATMSTTNEIQTFRIDSIGGDAELTVKTIYIGQDADFQRSEFSGLSLETVQKWYRDFYSDIYPDIESNGQIEISDKRDANVYTVVEHYKIKSFWKPSENDCDKIYFEVYSLSMEKLVNVPKSTTRTSPYNLGRPVTYYQSFKMQFPSPWSITPADTTIETPEYTYQYNVSSSGKDVIVYQKYNTISDNIPPEHMGQFVKDYQAMKNNLSYFITFDKVIGGKFILNWGAVAIAIVSLLLAVAIACLLYFKFDPTPEIQPEKTRSIGGWLIPFAIDMIAIPVSVVVGLVQANVFFDYRTWLTYLKAGYWGLFGFSVVELVYIVFNLVFAVAVVVLFFRRRSSFPQIVTPYLGIVLCMTIVNDIILNIVNNGSVEPSSYSNIVVVFAALVFWIPYSRYSNRVRETFVVRLNKKVKRSPEGE